MKLSKILNFIYPPTCYLCNTEISDNGLCSECFLQLHFSKNYCIRCGFSLDIGDICGKCLYNPTIFSSFHFVWNYNENIYNLMKQLKYNDGTYLVNYLQKVLTPKVKEGIDIIIPVPIHRYKLMVRKYNHMALIGKIIAKNKNISYSPFILEKVRRTKDQMKLSGKDRLKNLKNAFIIKEKQSILIKGKIVLLIDDIVTTGATIKECSTTLLQAGAKEVHILSLARVYGHLKI